jgi:hypothetical protein
VLGKVIDTFCQECNLHFWGTCIGCVNPVFGYRVAFCSNSHGNAFRFLAELREVEVAISRMTNSITPEQEAPMDITTLSVQNAPPDNYSYK